MSLTDPASRDTPKLEYSVLPSRSRITIEPTEQGVTVRIPPRSIFIPLGAVIVTSLMLLPMTLAISITLLRQHRLYADEWATLIFLGAVVTICWPLVVMVTWQTIRRRRVPTVLTVTGSALILVTPEHPKLRREFPIDEDLHLIVKPRGYGVGFLRLRPLGALHIAQKGATFMCLQGRDLREIQGIAHTLTEAMKCAQGVS
jgi:hypothetical protein